MSNLSSIEQMKLERLFEMGGGYVLNFTNRTFQDFILEFTGIDIYQNAYSDEGMSKAKRLRLFWKQESDYNVGKLIQGLLEYCKAQDLMNNRVIDESRQSILHECFQISQRLMEGRVIDDVAEINSHFEKIQEQIIQQIELARFIIWVAVAWFTDDKIFNKLLAKKNQGINVQLIIIDDNINNNSGLRYEELETYRIPKNGRLENIMHNKFCVIDLKTVIHGSYNWTKKAKFNNETITIINEYENAERFAEQFIILKSSQFI